MEDLNRTNNDIEMGTVKECLDTTPVDTSANPFSLDWVNSLPVAIAEPEIIKRVDDVIVANDFVPINVLNENVEEYMRVDGSRPSLISVQWIKEFRETSLGISFRSDDGMLRVRDINPHGPLGTSGIRSGDHVLALNNHRHCSRWTARQAVKFLQESTDFVTILIRDLSGDPNLHKGIVYKFKPEDRVGIIFRNDEQNRLRIKYLNRSASVGGLSALNEGDFVVAINDSDTHFLDAEVAKMMVRSTPSTVTILAKNKDRTEISLRKIEQFSQRAIAIFEAAEPVDATVNDLSSDIVHNNNISPLSMLEHERYMEEEGISPRFIYVKCEKPDIGTKLGISFQDSNGNLRIRSVDRTGVLGSSPLKPGCDLLAIDGRVCTAWTKSEILQYLKSRQSDIRIVARNPAGSASYVVAEITKPSPRSKVGISFKKSTSSPLKIGTVNPAGLFAGSILNDDYEVVSINGIPSRNITTSEAVGIVEQYTESVAIVAKTNPSTGIVLASLGPAALQGTPNEVLAATRAERNHKGEHCGAAAICVCLVIFFIIVIGSLG